MSVPVLASIAKWAPFQLDALGLVTIFGAKEMNTSIGNLAYSWVTDWLPVLGSYAVANNEIAQPEHGFVLYNITDGVMATDVAAWFTRWLISFPPNYTSTVIRLKMDGRPVTATQKGISLAIGSGVISLSLCFASLTADPWGIANSTAMALQVLVRQQMVQQLRMSINKTSERLQSQPGPEVKVFLTLPNGSAVTILGPRQAVVEFLLSEARPIRPRYYYALRAIGWVLFGTHAITLGMSNLMNQILTVVMLLSATYLTATHVGDRPYTIGTHLHMDVDLGDPTWKRGQAYARFKMTPIEEDNMVHWNMMPQRSNTFWWNRYRSQQPNSQKPAAQQAVHSAAPKSNAEVKNTPV
ncbi:hypothetical protein G7054_g1169 [Neopestalotiopsis clavispora]|nr:hypothetical protein G7054_g1169 [Neopestalotiopsis clavispora]